MIDAALADALNGWMRDALCIESTVDWWHPQLGDNKALTVAKTYCDRCAVKRECLRYAVDERIEGGCWGGLTEQDRRKLWPRRKAQSAA